MVRSFHKLSVTADSIVLCSQFYSIYHNSTFILFLPFDITKGGKHVADRIFRWENKTEHSYTSIKKKETNPSMCWSMRPLRVKVHIPSSILDCNQVCRQIAFFSTEEIKNLKLVQRVMLLESCIEEWTFKFGFVIPGSNNTWQQVIQAAGAGQMTNPKKLSGKMTVETCFYDGIDFIVKSVVRIYYTWKVCEV